MGYPRGGGAERTALLRLFRLPNAFNSIDHEALWRWLKELNIPDVDLLQSLYSGAYYTADLPYGRSAEVTLSRGQKQGDKSSPLLFGLVFNALLLALKATT